MNVGVTDGTLEAGTGGTVVTGAGEGVGPATSLLRMVTRTIEVLPGSAPGWDTRRRMEMFSESPPDLFTSQVPDANPTVAGAVALADVYISDNISQITINASTNVRFPGFFRIIAPRGPTG